MAFTEPSSDHIGIYIKVFIFAAICGYAAWYFLIDSRRQVENFKVNIDDIGGDSKANDEKVLPTKGDKKAAATGSSTAKKGDTRDTTGAEVQEYRSMSLKKEFNKRGPYERTQNGQMLTKEAYAKVVAIMQKHVWIKFHIVRRDIVEQRYGLYQDRTFNEYDKMIST